MKASPQGVRSVTSRPYFWSTCCLQQWVRTLLLWGPVKYNSSSLLCLGNLLSSIDQRLEKTSRAWYWVFVIWSLALGGNIVNPDKKILFIYVYLYYVCTYAYLYSDFVVTVFRKTVNSIISYDFFRYLYCYFTLHSSPPVCTSPSSLVRAPSFSHLSDHITCTLLFLLFYCSPIPLLQ